MIATKFETDFSPRLPISWKYYEKIILQIESTMCWGLPYLIPSSKFCRDTNDACCDIV